MQDNYLDSLSLNIKEHLLNGSHTSDAVLTTEKVQGLRGMNLALEVYDPVEETLTGTEEQSQRKTTPQQFPDSCSLLLLLLLLLLLILFIICNDLKYTLDWNKNYNLFSFLCTIWDSPRFPHNLAGN